MPEKQCQAKTSQPVQCNNDSEPCCASAAQSETETAALFCLSEGCQALAQEFYNLVGVFEPQCKYGSNYFIQSLARVCCFLDEFEMM